MHLLACFVALTLAAPPLRAPAEQVPDPRTVLPELPEELADDPPPPDAIAAYQRGVEAFDDGRYPSALEAFARAYGIHPTPEINLAIARTLLALENPQAAIRYARAYLARTTDHHYDTEATLLIEAARREMVREPVPPPPLRPTWRPLMISGGLLLGLGLSAVAGATIGLTATIEAREQELAGVLAGSPSSDPTSNDAARLNREISDLRVALIASATVSAAVALAGVVLLGVSVARRNQQRVAVGTTGRGISVSVRF